MSYETIRKLFKELCEIEIKTLRNDGMSVAEAKKLHGNVVSLHVKFLENQIHLTSRPQHHYNYASDRIYDTFDDISDYYNYENGNYPHLFDLIQQKATDLKKKLSKIAKPKDDEPTTSKDLRTVNQGGQNAMNIVESIRQKQDIYISLIESFEWDDDIGPREAETLLHHLSKVYDGYFWNQENINHSLKTKLEFEQQLRTAKDIQRKVIALETKLAKVASNKSASSSSAETESEDDDAAEAEIFTKPSSADEDDSSKSTSALLFIIILIVLFFVGRGLGSLVFSLF